MRINYSIASYCNCPKTDTANAVMIRTLSTAMREGRDIANSDLAILDTYKTNMRNHLDSIIVNRDMNLLSDIDPAVVQILPLGLQILKTPFVTHVHKCDDAFTKFFESAGYMKKGDHIAKDFTTANQIIDEYREMRGIDYNKFNDECSATIQLRYSGYTCHYINDTNQDPIFSKLRKKIFKKLVANRNKLKFKLPLTEINYDGTHPENESYDTLLIKPKLMITTDVIYDDRYDPSLLKAYEVIIELLLMWSIRDDEYNDYVDISYTSSCSIGRKGKVWSHREKVDVSVQD